MLTAMATTEVNPRRSPQSPCRIPLENTTDSDPESIELYEVTDVVTPATDSLSTAASAVTEKPAEATSDDPIQSHSEAEPAKGQTLVNSVSTSSNLPEEEPAESSSDEPNESSDSESQPDKSEEDPTEVMSVDTSDSGSDSESEPDKSKTLSFVLLA